MGNCKGKEGSPTQRDSSHGSSVNRHALKVVSAWGKVLVPYADSPEIPLLQKSLVSYISICKGAFLNCFLQSRLVQHFEPN